MTVEKQPSSLPAARAQYTAGWERIREQFLATGAPDMALAQRSALVDTLVSNAYREILASSVAGGLALLAVAGYGRRQLFPYSDVDLLLLFENERLVRSAKEPLAAFLQYLWDCGLRLSHSVRTPGECSEIHDHNIELNVCLLDQRFLIGDQALYRQFFERLPRFVRAQRETLIRNLSRLTRERYQKYNDTFYHLAPNIKETPGGIRDYQLVCWLRQIKNATAERLSAPEELPALRSARDFLFALRCHLHYQAGRDDNVLTFDAQERVAEQRHRKDPAEWMREYFQQARAVYRAATRMLEAGESQSLSLFAQILDRGARFSNADFSVARGRVFFKSPSHLQSDPELVLRLFQFVARHGIRLSLDSEERMASRLDQISSYFSESRPIWPALEEILSLPYAYVALRSMHETGVLCALFPELQQIECLVVRDFYHRYTVDEHSLMAIQILAELRQNDDPDLQSYREALLELEQPAVLAFALLFHDVGKGSGQPDHVEASARAADTAMARIQMPSSQQQIAGFLIRHHLAMSATINSRDLDEPSTARFMADQVETVELLKALTLLSFADISAVNPTAMTPWRREQLWRLYLLTYSELTRELDTRRITVTTTDSLEKAHFLEGFPVRYLRTHSEAEIDEHFRMEQNSRERGVLVDIKKLNGVYRTTIITKDRPFLFASIAGTLSGFGMNILKAEAFANRAATVLDTFTFADPHRNLELNPSEVERLQATLERVILGKADVKQLLQNRPKIPPPSKKARLQPSVTFDSEASASATLIQIIAQDRPGLLYDLAAAISSQDCNIEVVLIDTEAHKAIDVFYVTHGGRKLISEEQLRLQENLLEVCGQV